MREQLTTRGGVRYHELHPVYKYMVDSVARFEIPPRLSLDLSGRDCVRIRNGIGTADLALICADSVTVFPRYCWDGPTGGIDTENFLDGSLLHDVLCQAIDAGLLSPGCQGAADALMRRENRRHGMTRARAWWTWAAVRAYRSRKVAAYEWPRVHAPHPA